MITYKFVCEGHNVAMVYNDHDCFVTTEGWRAHIVRSSMSDLIQAIESSDPARRAEGEREIYWAWKMAKSAYDRI